MNNLKKIAIIFFLFASSSLFGEDLKGTIKIEVNGFKNDDGMARILIFSSKEKDGFPDDQNNAFIRKILPIKNQSVIYELNDIPFGEYAISIHHDRNNDGKLNKNLIGIPKESLGCSNDARGNFGPPKYNQAKIILNTKEKIVKIKMVN